MLKRTTLIALILAALLLAAAWGNGGEPAATPTPAPTPTPEPTLAAPTGCDPARPQAAGDFVQTIDSGGLTRRYMLHIPPSYSDTGGADATPLVLLFHGWSGNAKWIAEYTGLPAKADRAGFIAVMPQGLATRNIPEPHWNFTTLGPHGPGDPDDVAFIDDLLDALESELCIDSARVFSTGFSAGAHLSVRLACDLSDRIAAIAPVSGVYFPPFNPFHMPEPGCLSTQPVPVIAFHGTADKGVPFEGSSEDGRPSIGDEHIPGWAAHNGCASVPMEKQVTQNVRLVRYQDCDEDATVELYVIDGGGHQWPDATFEAEPQNFGSATHEISANDLMWDFFANSAQDASDDAPGLAGAGWLPSARGSQKTSAGIEGVVRGFRERSETNLFTGPTIVWTFHVYDSSGRLKPVPVQMRGRSFDVRITMFSTSSAIMGARSNMPVRGAINKGDRVQVSGKWRPERTVNAKRVHNLTTGALVRVHGPNWFLTFLPLMIPVAIVLAIVIYSLNVPSPRGPLPFYRS